MHRGDTMRGAGPIRIYALERQLLCLISGAKGPSMCLFLSSPSVTLQRLPHIMGLWGVNRKDGELMLCQKAALNKSVGQL